VSEKHSLNDLRRLASEYESIVGEAQHLLHAANAVVSTMATRLDRVVSIGKRDFDDLELAISKAIVTLKKLRP